jgi:hypothetical protein
VTLVVVTHAAGHIDTAETTMTTQFDRVTVQIRDAGRSMILATLGDLLQRGRAALS